MNDFDTARTNLQNATAAARAHQRIVREEVAGMASLCAGNLRISMPCSWRQGAHYETLRALKRELQDFDLTTGKWKD